MKKKRLMIAIVLLLMMTVSFIAPLNANTNAIVVSDIDYECIQLENDTVFQMAMDGNFINNSHTKVSVYYQNHGQEKVVEIKKLLSKKVYSDGTTEESHYDELIGIQSKITLERTGTDDGYTVSLKVGAQYNTKMFGADTYVKTIEFWCIPALLGGSFSLKSLSGMAVEQGVSYEGQLLNIKSHLATITNPVIGQQYNKITDFTQCVYAENSVYSYGKVMGKLEYGRGTSTYTFNLYLTLN